MSTDTNMSSDSSNNSNDMIPSREVARRVFAREFNDASYQFKESEDERAPNYSLLPTGEKANRVFIGGTVVEVEDVGTDNEYWRARVIDGSGAEEESSAASSFYVYAGQYQPEAAAVLRELEAPEYVTVVGKPRAYETDDGNTNVAIRPESVTIVDQETREQWILETAEQTLDRLESFESGSSPYAEMAASEYPDIDVEKYREGAREALKTIVDDTSHD